MLDENGQQIGDPILRFLKSKTGYCVQFASTMVMMARAKGIPARMALGFLPGTQDEGLFTVRSSDAHAWPELYFAGRRLAPVRAHAGRAHRLRADLHDPGRSPAPRGDDGAVDRPRGHRFGDEHRPRPGSSRGRRAGHGRHDLGH